MSNPAFILPDFLATYVQEPGGISRSNIDRDCGSMLKVVHRHAELLGPAGVRSQEAIVQRRWAADYLFKGQPAKALPHAFRRLRLQPKSLQAWWIVFKSSVRTILSGGRSRRVHPAAMTSIIVAEQAIGALPKLVAHVAVSWMRRASRRALR